MHDELDRGWYCGARLARPLSPYEILDAPADGTFAHIAWLAATVFGTCQFGGDTPCPAAPELKVADAWGDSAWGCLAHVEEAILNARSVFVADAKLAGLSAYLGNRPVH